MAAETVLGLAIALALNVDFRGKGLLRTAILVPWAIPTIVSARMWNWMLHDHFGIINDILIRLGVISTGIPWTADPSTAASTRWHRPASSARWCALPSKNDAKPAVFHEQQVFC